MSRPTNSSRFHQTKLVSVVEAASRLLLVTVFLVAATGKLLHPTDFVQQVANYQFWPALSPWVAVVVPAVEVAASLVLLFAPRSWRQAAALVFGGLLVVFSIAIARAWMLGVDAECGCFGSGSSSIGIWPLLRNTTLFLVATVLVVLNQPRGDRSPAAA